MAHLAILCYKDVIKFVIFYVSPIVCFLNFVLLFECSLFGAKLSYRQFCYLSNVVLVRCNVISDGITLVDFVLLYSMGRGTEPRVIFFMKITYNSDQPLYVHQWGTNLLFQRLHCYAVMFQRKYRHAEFEQNY